MTPEQLESIPAETITLTFDSASRTVKINDHYTIRCSEERWEMKCDDEFLVWFWALNH